MMFYLKQVVPIIVTYNPSIGVLAKLLGSLDAFKTVQLVDNGSYNVIALKELCSKHENVQSSFLNSNIGLAEAQNKAVESILNRTSEGAFILLLDQDSVPVDSCIEILYDYAVKLTNEGARLGVIGPALLDAFSDSSYGFIKNGKRFYKEESISDVFVCDGINSSGSLIPLACWREMGGNNRQLFIDHVETDWCFRARDAGYVCYGTFDAVLSHSMGESTIKYWFFGWRNMPDRSPERHYYLFRNSMFLQKMSYVPLNWKLTNLVKLLFTVCYFGLFSTKRIQHFSNIYRGVIEGVHVRLGKNQVS